MLNYLGPSVGPTGPITTQLPPATPGTMQDAVPGIPSAPAPLPPATFHKPPAGATPHQTAISNKANGHTPASALAAILKHASSTGGPLAPAPQKSEYKAVTQSDGTALLHRLNPNGSLGPVVKVITGLKDASEK